MNATEAFYSHWMLVPTITDGYDNLQNIYIVCIENLYTLCVLLDPKHLTVKYLYIHDVAIYY